MRVVQRPAVLTARSTSGICSICTPLNTASSASTPGVNRQNKGKTPKNMTHMHHICTLSGRKPPQEPCASTSSPSPSKMERGPGGEACDKPACKDRRVLPTIGSYRYSTPNAENFADAIVSEISVSPLGS